MLADLTNSDPTTPLLINHCSQNESHALSAQHLGTFPQQCAPAFVLDIPRSPRQPEFHAPLVYKHALCPYWSRLECV